MKTGYAERVGQSRDSIVVLRAIVILKERVLCATEGPPCNPLSVT
jgi:hypothetical protein